jgi:hypothetical protein
MKEKILNTLEAIAVQYRVSIVVVGSYAKGGYIYDHNNSIEENSDIEIVVYGSRLKIFRIQRELSGFFSGINIKYSLQKGRLKSIPRRSLTLYEFDEIKFGVRLGNQSPSLNITSCQIHNLERWLLLSNRQFELILKKRKGMCVKRASEKLKFALKDLCISLQCDDSDLFNVNTFPRRLIVHKNYKKLRVLIYYVVRTGRLPSLRYGSMKTQVYLLKWLAAGKSIEDFDKNIVLEWEKSIGE